MLAKKRQTFIWLTALAVFTLFLLLLWRQGHLPTPFLVAWGIIAWIAAFVAYGRPLPTKENMFRWIWSLWGAFFWWGSVLISLGIVWLIGYLQGKTPSLHALSQEFLGFSLAYIIGFALYHFFRLFID